MKKALVTGAAGFIGFHCCRRLLAAGYEVVGVDAMTDYYEVSLKTARLSRLTGNPGFSFVQGYVETRDLLADLFARHRFDLVIHLAAQAGVRFSIRDPRAFLDGNISGTFELLEAARAHPPAHMLLASSSSVYGANTQMPYAELHRAAHPMSFYAASKQAVESMAHAFSHIHGLPITLFRFFTVYGPWGRPDMAPYKFTRKIIAGETIDVYNHGQMQRDFTYIDDLIEALARLVPMPPPPVRGRGAPIAGDSLSPVAPWRVLNIGNAQPVQLGDFIAAIETATGCTATRNLMTMQPGDVPATWADVDLLHALTGYTPATPLAEGMAHFVDWFRDYYGAQVTDGPTAQ